MAINDYFVDIIVLKQIEGQENDLVGGRNNTWGELAIIKGIINQRYENPSTSFGKSGESSEYVGYFEYSEDNELIYLSIENRLKDQNGYIYKIKGKPKNTLRKNHHLRIELIYVDYIKDL